MKINRFDKDMILERVSPKIREFIFEFTDDIGENILDWIENVSKDNLSLPEYKLLKNKTAILFAEKYNFINLKEYYMTVNKIEQLQKEIEKLEKSIESNPSDVKYLGEIYVKAAYELSYKFQEDLILNNFDKFKTLILNESDDPLDEGLLLDVHPDILKKYENEIMSRVNAKKYNL